MNPQEQNWTNLFGQHSNHATAWYGLWTVYSPDKKVVNAYQGIRSFWANEDKTVITHTNNYTYADGSTVSKTWQLEKETCNQPDGVVHPAALSMLSLSFGEIGTAWVSKKLETGKKFGIELFFRYQEWRTSTATIYGENGEFEKIMQIREHLGSFPNQHPEAEVKNLAGNWLGRKKYMTPDLNVSPAEATQELMLDPTKGKNETIFLNDGIVLNIPKTLKVGEEFDVVIGKLVSPNEYQRLTAKYDNFGSFMMLVSEVFCREE